MTAAIFGEFYLLENGRTNQILYSLVKRIKLYLQIFNTAFQKSFQNLSLKFILKIFIKIPKFQPWYSHKIYSYYTKMRVRVEIFY